MERAAPKLGWDAECGHLIIDQPSEVVEAHWRVRPLVGFLVS
jgi:hypothetical protein